MSIQLSLTIDLPATDVAADFMIKLSEAFALLKGLAMPAAKPAPVARGTTAPAVHVGEPEKPAETPPAETPPADLPKPASERKPRAPKAPAKAEEPAAARAEIKQEMMRDALIDELRTLGNALVNKLGGNVVRGELAKFGAAKYPDLSDDDARKLHATFKRLSAEA